MNVRTIDPTTLVEPHHVPEALIHAHIPTHTWTQGVERGIAELICSLKTEQVSLHNQHGKLVLHIHVAVPYIGYLGPNLQELYEAYQVRLDGEYAGKIHVNSRLFQGSLGETLNKNEDYWTATRRGLHEELGWDSETPLYDLSAWQGEYLEVIGPCACSKYHGICAVYHRYRTHCIIDRELYRPEGYVHIDAHKRKKEVFLWKDI